MKTTLSATDRQILATLETLGKSATWFELLAEGFSYSEISSAVRRGILRESPRKVLSLQ